MPLHDCTRKVSVSLDDLVFCYDDGSRLGGTWWKKRYTKGMEAAGIDYKGRDLSSHSFRHTLNTVIGSRGLSDINLRAAFGRTGERMQENCTHTQLERLKDQADIVETIFVQKKDIETADGQ